MHPCRIVLPVGNDFPQKQGQKPKGKRSIIAAMHVGKRRIGAEKSGAIDFKEFLSKASALSQG